MTQCVGFGPVSRPDARMLILGTLPGAESLKQRQYYARKQNGFWKIMGELTGAAPDPPYKERLGGLTKNGIALWDVCASARRKGSLDADIKSEKFNDFISFFKKHKNIKLICFNGREAEKKFRIHIMPKISDRIFEFRSLPSTSPAYAGMPYKQKLARWRAALESVVKANAF